MSATRAVSNFLGGGAGDGVSGALGQSYSHYQILLRATRRQQRIIVLAKFLKRGNRNSHLVFAAAVDALLLLFGGLLDAEHWNPRYSWRGGGQKRQFAPAAGFQRVIRDRGRVHHRNRRILEDGGDGSRGRPPALCFTRVADGRRALFHGGADICGAGLP